MNESHDTECVIVQLQIDGLLDNELEPKQQQSALEHVRACPDCAREFLLARSLRDVMLDLPRPELPPTLLAKVFEQAGAQSAGLLGRLRLLLGGARLRLAVPAFAALAAVAVWLRFGAPVAPEPPLAAEEQYTREDLAAAIQDLNTTIRTLNEISESMRVRLGDRMVGLPVLSLPALSVDRTDSGASAPVPDDPI